MSQAHEQESRQSDDRDCGTEDQGNAEDSQHLSIEVAILEAEVLMSPPRCRIIKVVTFLERQPRGEIRQENVLQIEQIEGRREECLLDQDRHKEDA
jgi:hypothetical protein